eukprot:SAG11_NODE_14980_length_592_cov_1.515213_1_plen_51_part_01
MPGGAAASAATGERDVATVAERGTAAGVAAAGEHSKAKIRTGCGILGGGGG